MRGDQSLDLRSSAAICTKGSFPRSAISNPPVAYRPAVPIPCRRLLIYGKSGVRLEAAVCGPIREWPQSPSCCRSTGAAMSTWTNDGFRDR